MKILFISYFDFDNFKYGSTIRPYKMYEAFCNLGHEVILYNGEQTRENRKNRIKQGKKILELLKSDIIDFCYIESSVNAIRFNIDYKIISYLNSKNIPTGFFYRDFYYKFPKDVNLDKSFVDKIKDIYFKYLWSKTNRYLHKIDIIFFPSSECFKYFNFKKMYSLYPGSDPNCANLSMNNICIYVGGLSERYGTDILIKAFDKLNSEGFEVYLNLVCRKKEYEKYKKQYKHPNWLNVYHLSANQIDDIYKNSSIAILPLLHNEYNNLAVPVKLFEYMSYGLPIVATKNAAIEKILKEADCGLIVDDNEHDLASAIKNLFVDEKLIKKLSNNAHKYSQNNGLWEHRAKRVIELLSKK